MIKPETRSRYQPAIGIETHVQLKTKTKLFCACQNDATAEEPNINVCPICMGFPGTLPVLNEAAVKLALRIGLALNGRIAKETKFDRKNYFYPDLPKGYQISQYDQPIIGKGEVEVPFKNDNFKVGITRAHLEEDAGKLLHPPGADYSLVDLNRAGTPLMEIVSEPDIKSAAQAKAYAQEIYLTILYAGVSDADLYRGNVRFDVNVSLSKQGDKGLGTRSETKNLNSFRSIERAVEYEINRQVEVLEKGEKVIQETRGWDEAKGKTTGQRGKEEAHDYRYFPEPDLPPLVITESMIAKAKPELPTLPKEIRQALTRTGVDKDTIEVLLKNPTATKQLLSFINMPEHVIGIAKYYAGKILAYKKEHPDKGVDVIKVGHLVKLHEMQKSGKVSSSSVDQILEEIMNKDEDPEVIAERLELFQVSDVSQITKIVDRVIKTNPKPVDDYQKGHQQSLQFLVGQVMKESKGQANPQLARELLEKKIGSLE